VAHAPISGTTELVGANLHAAFVVSAAADLSAVVEGSERNVAVVQTTAAIPRHTLCHHVTELDARMCANQRRDRVGGSK